MTSHASCETYIFSHHPGVNSFSPAGIHPTQFIPLQLINGFKSCSPLPTTLLIDRGSLVGKKSYLCIVLITAYAHFHSGSGCQDSESGDYNNLMTPDIDATKRQLRLECRRTRAAINKNSQRKASEMICSHIGSWGEFQRVDTILTYMPMRGEVDLTGLLEKYPGKNWAVPRILPGGRMLFHTYDHLKLLMHTYGMLEPDPCCPLISPQEIQLVLVPGLAFDRDGCRLGYGGGFYDRFLIGLEGVSAGITYNSLILPHIPHLSHDIPMKALVTENGIITTGDQYC